MRKPLISRAVCVSVCLCWAGQTQAAPASGANLWLRASSLSGLLDGDLVPSWSDDSGSGLHVGQPNPLTQPKYYSNAINGQPVVRFDGDDFLFRDSVLGSQLSSATDVSVFVIMKQLGTDSFSSSVGWGSGSNRLVLHTTWGDSIFFQHGDPGGALVTGEPSGWDDAFHQVEFLRSGSAGEIHVDGGAVHSGTFGSSMITGESHRLHIGDDQFSNFLTGDIAEVLIYDRALTPAELENTRNYLYATYALPEPTTLSMLVLTGIVLIRRRTQR